MGVVVIAITPDEEAGCDGDGRQEFLPLATSDDRLILQRQLSRGCSGRRRMMKTKTKTKTKKSEGRNGKWEIVEWKDGMMVDDGERG